MNGVLLLSVGLRCFTPVEESHNLINVINCNACE